MALLAWGWPVAFERAAALWLLPPLALLVWTMSRRSLSGLSPVRRWLAVLTRVSVLTLLVMALAGAQRTKRNRDLTVIYAIDVSKSVPPSQQEAAWKFIRQSAKKTPVQDRVGIVAFDGSTTIEQLPQKAGPDGAVHIDRLSPPLRPDKTNIGAAISTALAMFPDDTAKRVVLLTDGNQTDGDVTAEARTAVANGVAIDVVPLRYEHRNEIIVDKLQAPAYAHLDDQVPLKVTIRSERACSGTMTLFHDGEIVALGGDPTRPAQRVDLHVGNNTFTVKVPVKHTGSHAWEARIQPDHGEDDEVVANNVARAFTSVEGIATVLYLRHSPDDKHVEADDLPLIEALRKEKIEVEVHIASAANLDPSKLGQYAAVILANVPADELTESQHQALASYVKDLGGGLVMVGGDDTFGAGGWQGSIVEGVMPVKFDVDEVKQIPRGALVVIAHSCEMAQGNYWGVEVCCAALKPLSRLDYFGLVDWGRGAGGYAWEVPLKLAEDKAAIERQIRKMQNMDMPDYNEPMDMAYKALRARTDAAQKHVILISDGDCMPPTAGTVNRYRGAKITVSTVSIFPHGGAEIGTLKSIAQQCGGKYYNLSSPGDEKKLPQIFIKEAKVVRRPLLREEPFRPRLRQRSDILDPRDFPDFPTLRGYVVTTPRGAGEMAEMPLVSDKGDPILAHWNAGLGKSVAFTSGWWTHWGPEWTTWPNYSKLWVQAVRWCMAQGSAANFSVVTRVERDKAHIVAEALNSDTAFLNFLHLNGKVIQPDGTSRDIELKQTGPGRYEAEFPVNREGTYLAAIQAIRQTEKGAEHVALIRAGVPISYSAEYRELHANEAMLKELAGASPKGRLLAGDPDSADIFSHDLPESVSRQPIWDSLLKWAIFLFLWDVAVRRVAVDPRVVARRMRQFIADLAGRFAAGGRAEAVLTDLKGVREKVRAEKTAAAAAEAVKAARQVSAASPEARADRGKKFEAARGAAPAGDLRETLGAAKAQSPAAKPDPGADASTEATTARLLKAKKRVQTERREDGS